MSTTKSRSQKHADDSTNSAHQQSSSSSSSTEPYSIFDTKEKILIVFLVSTAATFSGFASNIYFPALPAIAKDLSVSTTLVNLSVTSYLIFQGLAPSLWGPLSDVRGRRTAYICTFLVFLGASIGLAQTRNYATLITLRCLQSTGSASTIAIGSGVIGDITTRAERGGFMGFFQAGQLVALSIGPVVGGALAGSLGWRSIFWFLTIYSGVFLGFLVLLLPETLRSIVANGSRIPSNPILSYPLSLYKRFTTVEWNLESESSMKVGPRRSIDVTGPFQILFSKSAVSIIVFLAIYYTVWQMSITAMSTLFKERYHLNELQLGLTYIANGAGSMIGTLITGKILDHDYGRVAAKHNRLSSDSEGDEDNSRQRDDENFPLEYARLRLVPIFSVLQCVSIVVFGWTVNYSDRVHIAVPIACTFVTGWTAISTQSVVMTYLVDVFSDRSAAASASTNLARCFLAAGGTSAVNPMTNTMGVGLAFTTCAVVQFVAITGIVVQWKFGGKWRREAETKKRRSVQGEDS